MLGSEDFSSIYLETYISKILKKSESATCLVMQFDF